MLIHNFQRFTQILDEKKKKVSFILHLMFWVLCENLRKRKKRRNFHSQLWAVGNFLREKSLSLCLLIKLSCWIFINIQSICQRHRRININKCVDEVDRNVSRVRLMSLFDCCWCPIQSREREERFSSREWEKNRRGKLLIFSLFSFHRFSDCHRCRSCPVICSIC